MFMNYLLKSEDFLKLIEVCRSSLDFSGTKMFILSRKLKEMKGVIRNFSKLHYSNLELRVKEAHDILIALQRELQTVPSQSCAEQEREAHRKWLILATAEESFLRQRAKVTRLAEGDCNSRFFHQAIISRSATNHIHFLIDDVGAVIENHEQVKSHIIDFYQNLLGTDSTPTTVSESLLGSLIKTKCSEHF